MSTARIVSLVVVGVGLIAGFGLIAYAQSISKIAVIGGRLAFDEDAAQQASSLSIVGILIVLVGFGGLATFAALTVRDRKQDEAAD